MPTLSETIAVWLPRATSQLAVRLWITDVPDGRASFRASAAARHAPACASMSIVRAAATAMS